jgi:hypothetical protein
MSTLDGLVEVAYFISVEGLREICELLTNEKHTYNVTRYDDKTVTIWYNDGPDDLNAISYSFPICVNVNLKRTIPCFGEHWPFGADGFIAVLHIYTKKPIREGLYLEDGELVRDFIEDWERFWSPLKAALCKELKL